MPTLAVGAGVGLALPQTQRENQWLGETCAVLLDKAQTAAQGTLEQVQRVAERVTEELVGTGGQAKPDQGERGGNV